MELYLNDNIPVHMQAVYNLRERRYVGGEQGARHQIFLFFICYFSFGKFLSNKHG